MKMMCFFWWSWCIWKLSHVQKIIWNWRSVVALIAVSAVGTTKVKSCWRLSSCVLIGLWSSVSKFLSLRIARCVTRKSNLSNIRRVRSRSIRVRQMVTRVTRCIEHIWHTLRTSSSTIDVTTRIVLIWIYALRIVTLQIYWHLDSYSYKERFRFYIFPRW